jgi:para-aminobenzoate synthetase component I
MHPLVEEIETTCVPDLLAERLRGHPCLVLLRSALFDSPQARYSLVTARPFLTFRSFGSRCEVRSAEHAEVQFGDPWRLLEALMGRFEQLDAVDFPFPLGGAFGYWGYDLKNFVEPKLPSRAINDLELPDCQVGFYASLVVFDHRLAKTWIVATGLAEDGSCDGSRAREQVDFWRQQLGGDVPSLPARPAERLVVAGANGTLLERAGPEAGDTAGLGTRVTSNLSRADFEARVRQAQRYIRSGDIYQVNLSQRLAVRGEVPGWDFFQRLSAVSPAPFSAYLDCGQFQIASSSPELFLRISGGHVQTRPIKGTRPRAGDAARDAQLAYELQTSPKEMAELIMITDLLRNDLGRVCEFGSVRVPELARLELYPHVQHLVSTVEGRLRREVTHLAALAACFPGGSITGAPKFRAMEIIDELEPVTRGPYTGALGYLGFNRESQWSIIIRTAICAGRTAWFQVGAGIVADSVPGAEYEETLAKAGGFLEALRSQPRPAPQNAGILLP